MGKPTVDEVAIIMRQFAMIAPGFRDWWRNHRDKTAKEFSEDKKSATLRVRESWHKALGRYDNADISEVLELLESGRYEVPPYGEAARTIARHCQAIVDKRLAEKRNNEWRENLQRPEGDTSPDCTPEEVRELKQRRVGMGDEFRAKHLLASGACETMEQALDMAVKEKRKGRP